MSSLPPQPPTIFMQAKALALSNDVSGLTALFAGTPQSERQQLADMALIGATEAQPTNKEAAAWALKAGACELWGIQQATDLWKRVGKDTNRGLRMLGGPGEVAKGTFSGSK